ncbi:hypothetical protein J6590_053154 [Homalodisca vitripennis]|nr:hypothetical protein J6590_053154 [Homalodisca vitripennis]
MLIVLVKVKTVIQGSRGRPLYPLKRCKVIIEGCTLYHGADVLPIQCYGPSWPGHGSNSRLPTNQ